MRVQRRDDARGLLVVHARHANGVLDVIERGGAHGVPVVVVASDQFIEGATAVDVIGVGAQDRQDQLVHRRPIRSPVRLAVKIEQPIVDLPRLFLFVHFQLDRSNQILIHEEHQ